MIDLNRSCKGEEHNARRCYFALGYSRSTSAEQRHRLRTDIDRNGEMIRRMFIFRKDRCSVRHFRMNMSAAHPLVGLVFGVQDMVDPFPLVAVVENWVLKRGRVKGREINLFLVS